MVAKPGPLELLLGLVASHSSGFLPKKVLHPFWGQGGKRGSSEKGAFRPNDNVSCSMLGFVSHALTAVPFSLSCFMTYFKLIIVVTFTSSL